jgi:preprotein translocase subunit SecE
MFGGRGTRPRATAELEGSRKYMAKSAAIQVSAGEGLGARLKVWPQRIKSFYQDVRTEMKKVTTPSRKEVQATTGVVIITVFLFGLYFWVVDTLIGRGIDKVLRYFAHR